MSVRVRFAPSPTGRLHVGNIRTALANVLFARRNGGTFVLRLEDTDLSREVAAAEKNIFHDLAWLGLAPDEGPQNPGSFGPYRTNERAKRGDYTKAIEKLTAAGRAYECFVSREELDLMRKIQRSQGKPPHYDGRHRELTEVQKDEFRAQGRRPVIRFRLDEGATVTFHDLVRGPTSFEAKHLGGDPVIVRENGVPLFTLAGVVDDINQNITHIIRGEDHVTNTAIQVQIFEALGAKMPTTAHLPMLMDKDGGKLSKRLDSLAIHTLREEGFLPQTIVAYLASLGFSHGPQTGNIDAQAKLFDLENIGRSPVRFDEGQLCRLNAAFLREMSFAEVKPHMNGFWQQTGLDEASVARLWEASRENIELLSDLKGQYEICFGNLPPVDLNEADAAYIRTAEQNLPTGPYTGETWQQWVGTLKEKTGRKGKELFMPLRLALTGQPHGPELAALMPVMGEETIRNRLKAAGGQ